MRCPEGKRGQFGQRYTIIGCGSENVIGPDGEGLYDCLDCGMWFDPDLEVRHGKSPETVRLAKELGATV